MSGNVDYSAHRKASFPAPHGYPLAGPYASQASALRAAQYLTAGAPMVQHGDNSVAALAQGFGGMNLQTAPYGPPPRANSHFAAPSQEYGNVAMGAHQPMMMHGQPHVIYGGHVMTGPAGNPPPNGMFAPVAHYVPQPAFPGYAPHVQQDNGQHGQPGQNWTPRVPSDGSQGLPTLVTPRRDSVSSNEEHLPPTPYAAYGGYHNGVAVMDRSPSGVFSHSGTPSPSQFMAPYAVSQNGKSPVTSHVTLKLQLLVQQDPAIPRAIPAPSSPMKPLDRCLENKNGETNVYIRGLLPETTDEMLHSWGIRFGDIQSSKSIIDLKTNLCKGFGFIKYHNFEDAENCIRGFHYLGYEVSFARESFYAKLKKFADEANTNLYVSNIPRNMNEHELSMCFVPYKVCSARILRDDSGNGRGVGFARFETRDVCEEVIKKFNNTPVVKAGGDEHIIQIRYSDTHEQKMLKQQTAAARQFRAAEFEFGCIQAGRNGLLAPPGGSDRTGSVSPVQRDPSFDGYIQHPHTVK
ncbi:hypothetical protein EJ06DRAFT_483036 [Trichodelitschia bisporula]|uniref:RRM domain-containing protein n=1 Tax=Trichodelitschia bisporula TaxID=703511 RepID=A0A6G1HKX0_9PEZI|nr:hypothetical protein EJ06DRAFT_483036 [Trichodelitschia bisporula]